MPDHPRLLRFARSPLALITLVCLALVLTWTVSGAVFARELFQSTLPTATWDPNSPIVSTWTPTDVPPPVDQPPTATLTATLIPTSQPSPTATRPGAPTAIPTATPTFGLVPTIPPPVVPTATLFVTPEPLPEFDLTPTPTLELPTDEPPIAAAAPAGVSGFLPAPTLVSPEDVLGRPLPGQGNAPLTGPAVAAIEPTAEPDTPAPGVAELIDSGIVALSYVWICCGGLLLLGVAAAAYFLARRNRRP